MLAGATLLVRDGLEDPYAPGIGEGFGDQLELAWGEPVASSGLGAHSFIVIELSHGSQGECDRGDPLYIADSSSPQ
jgi:hypothetical protein